MKNKIKTPKGSIREIKFLKKQITELKKSNRKLKQLVLRDPQTGLYNYRYLMEAIDAEIYRAKRFAHSVSLIMLDIDYFKSINNTYGHQFGDLVLKQFSNFLKIIVRQYDIIIRLSGGEFMVIAPWIDRSEGLILARKFLDTVTGHTFGDKKRVVKLKVSVAVVSYPSDVAGEGRDLLNAVDAVLDKTKEDGGNRVYSYSEAKKTQPFINGDTMPHPSVKHLHEKINKLTKQANQSLIESIFALAKTIELKDRYTGEHVEMTVKYATDIAEVLGLPANEVEHIRQAAMLHDLGKIGISEKILLKKTKLTKKEFELIKKHPQVGADILRPIQLLHDVVPMVLYHHERWDGKGYPTGLKLEEIPIGARVVAISDVYQALTSDRPYRKAYPKEEAVEIIRKAAGTQFDPKVVSAFLKVVQAREA